MKLIVKEGKGPYKFKVRLTLDDGGRLGPESMEKLTKAVQHFADAYSSQEFKDFVLGYEYSKNVCTGRFWWKKCRRENVSGMRWNESKSQEEIYDHLLMGREDLRPEDDQEADIDLVIDYRSSRNVIGYTYPNSLKQWIYYKFFRRFSYQQVAGNISHEFAHKMGYGHEFRYSSLRKHTVPYCTGDFVRGFEPKESTK